MRIFPLLILLAISGCAARDAELGGAVQSTIVAQVVDLNPVYAGVPIEGGNGERSVEAVKRYKKGTVKALIGESIGKKQ